MFVAFMGTKLKGDLITNARIYQELLWGHQHLEWVMILEDLCSQEHLNRDSYFCGSCCEEFPGCHI